MVTELYVFGSFARGAVAPHDLDIDVEFERDDQWISHFVTALSYGRDPHSPIRRMLTGGKRGCQFTFNFRKQADFDLTMLWQKGDDLAVALARLDAIGADPTAGEHREIRCSRNLRVSTRGCRALIARPWLRPLTMPPSASSA